MSLGIVVNGSEGIVLAADSRVTLDVKRGNQGQPSVYYDNATKLLSFAKQPHIGAVTYGVALIGNRTPHSYIPEFENGLENGRLSVLEFTQKFSTFFRHRLKSEPKRPPGTETYFIVGGYNNRASYGAVYTFSLPSEPTPVRKREEGNFGIDWGGQWDIVGRLINGHGPELLSALHSDQTLSEDQRHRIETTLKQFGFPTPYAVLPLQDCVNLATLLIRTTISMQSFSLAERGVGGPIDVATITQAEGLRFLQKKVVTG